MRFLETMLIVRAISEAGASAAGGQVTSKLQELFKDYTNLMYPELKTETESKAAFVERIMKTEHARGPLKVQTQEYGKKRGRKGR